MLGMVLCSSLFLVVVPPFIFGPLPTVGRIYFVNENIRKWSRVSAPTEQHVRLVRKSSSLARTTSSLQEAFYIGGSFNSPLPYESWLGYAATQKDWPGFYYMGSCLSIVQHGTEHLLGSLQFEKIPSLPQFLLLTPSVLYQKHLQPHWSCHFVCFITL